MTATSHSDRPDLVREADCQNAVRLFFARRVPRAQLFRANTGRVRMRDGRCFDTGLPAGFPDLFGHVDGRAIFIEMKGADTPTEPHQHAFLQRARDAGAIAFVARSPEDVAWELDIAGVHYDPRPWWSAEL